MTRSTIVNSDFESSDGNEYARQGNSNDNDWGTYEFEMLGLSFERFGESIKSVTLAIVSMGITSESVQQFGVIDWGGGIGDYPSSSKIDIVEYVRSFSYTPEDYWIDPYIETLDERFEYQDYVWGQVWLGISYPIRWGYERFQGRINSTQNRDNEG